MPRDLIHAPGHDRNRSLGWLAVAWMEHFTVHGPGDVEGERVVLDDELTELTVDCYTLEADGRRQYDSAFISRAKGRDKSGHAGRHVIFEALGPCRFLRWAEGGEVFQQLDFRYTYQAGEPMGRPVKHPVIRCLATEEGQAGNTYDNVYYNLTEGPLASLFATGAVGLTRTLLPDGGEIIPSSASNSAKDGGKETFVVFDETHLYILPELHRMYRTVRRNLAKRKSAEPWSLETSTMYMPGEGSVAEETHNTAKMIREGKLKRSRTLFDHREAPADVDLADEKALTAALHEVYGPFAEVMDLRRIIDEIWDPRNPPSDSRRYYLNQPTSSADAWLRDYEWKACETAGVVVDKGDPITLGFDGSKSRKKGLADATALVACRVSDAHTWLVQAWEQPDGPGGKDWEVPVGNVDTTVRDMFRTHNVVGFFADPARWESYVAQWEADFHKKLKVKATQAHPITYWVNGGRSLIIGRALDQFHGAIVAKEMTHDGGSVLSRHMLNARRRPRRDALWIAKEHPDSAHKIDAAWAATLAYAARLAALAAGGSPKTFAPRRIR